jgi:uncharacterized protein YjdB
MQVTGSISTMRAALAWLAALVLAVTVSSTAAQAAPVTPDLPTLNVTLADPDPTRNTIDYLHASKDNKVPATMTLEDPTGQFSFSDLPGEIKGRGNFTWRLAKRPYQIKFVDSRAVLGMESARTWVLLANHADPSLMRNKLAYDLAGNIGMPFSPTSRWVDVRINGTYYGNYLLSEKTEVKKNRVQLTHPQGVLVELDNNYGTAEDYYFRTGSTNSLFVLKEAVSDVPDKDVAPLPADTQAGWDDVRATLNELDGLLTAYNPDWDAISRLIDVDSFVKHYFVHELAENPEITQSSIYFYKDGPDDVLHAGPIWDFDSSLGNYDKSEAYGAFTGSEYVKNAHILRNKGNSWNYHLFRNTEFVERTNTLWTEVVGPQVAALPAAIDGYRATVQNSAAKNFERWPTILGGPTLLIAGEGHDIAPTYAGEVAYLKDWVTRRGNHLASAYGDVPTLRYQAHVASLGWMHKVNSGQISGTVRQSRRLEAVKLNIHSSSTAGAIQANTHVQNVGWSGFKSADLMGTTGLGLRMEAMQLRLTGDLAAKYDISYRAHVSGIGWQPWVTNGQTAGTTGQARQVEAVQVRLLRKGVNTVVPKGTTTYSAHVQNIGWMSSVTDGAVAGTTGRSLRMEALRLKATSTIATGDIQYRAHVQNVGWQTWRNSSTYVGTVGSGLRMEAVQIKLSGDLATSYRIRYQTHVQGIGWQPWVYDGATAGTTGQARRIEAIKVELVPR